MEARTGCETSRRSSEQQHSPATSIERGEVGRWGGSRGDFDETGEMPHGSSHRCLGRVHGLRGQASFIRLADRAFTGSNGSAWGPGHRFSAWTRPPHDGKHRELLAQKRRAETYAARSLDVLPALLPLHPFLRASARPNVQKNTTTDVPDAMATCSAQPRPTSSAKLWKLCEARIGCDSRCARTCHRAPLPHAPDTSFLESNCHTIVCTRHLWLARQFCAPR